MAVTVVTAMVVTVVTAMVVTVVTAVAVTVVTAMVVTVVTAVAVTAVVVTAGVNVKSPKNITPVTVTRSKSKSPRRIFMLMKNPKKGEVVEAGAGAMEVILMDTEAVGEVMAAMAPTVVMVGVETVTTDYEHG
ncbi:hypothetical protein F4678DRAFT_433592 [Xylaria arbuscula]|nr:hypothetical protein F4678DRAFT_433592 [Xylaria arbuscula]